MPSGIQRKNDPNIEEKKKNLKISETHNKRVRKPNPLSRKIRSRFFFFHFILKHKISIFLSRVFISERWVSVYQDSRYWFSFFRFPLFFPILLYFISNNFDYLAFYDFILRKVFFLFFFFWRAYIIFGEKEVVFFFEDDCRFFPLYIKYKKTFSIFFFFWLLVGKENFNIFFLFNFGFNILGID